MRYSAILINILAVSALAFFVSSCMIEPKSKVDGKNELAKLQGPDTGSVNKALFGQAEQAANMGDFRRASQMYQQLADQYPDKKEYSIALADSLRRAGNNGAALKVINALLKKDQENAAALEVKGLTLMNMGEFSGASKALGSVMKIDTKRWRTLNGLGILFAIKKMNPQAVQYYNAALKVSPDNPGVLNNLGLALAMDKQYGDAIDMFIHARNQLDNNSQQLRHIDLNLALVYAIAGKLDEAEQTAAPHLSKVALYNNMGFYAYIAKNTELAKSYLNMALTQDPVYYERAWKNLSVLNGEVVSEQNVTNNMSKGRPAADEEGEAPPHAAAAAPAKKEPDAKEATPVFNEPAAAPVDTRQKKPVVAEKKEKQDVEKNDTPEAKPDTSFLAPPGAPASVSP